MVHWNAASCEMCVPSRGSSEAGAELVQIPADAQRDFFGIEDLVRVEGRAVFRAASAFDARIDLQRDQLRHIFAGNESEIFIAHERRNSAETAA